MTETAAIIVAYQSAAVLGPAVASCLDAGIEVIVIDNESSGDTATVVRQYANRGRLTLVENSENLGFAGAVNQGVRLTTQPFLLLLNPDAALRDGRQTVPLLEAACREPRVAAAAGKLVDANGIFQQGFAVRRLPTPAALALESLGINYLWPTNPVNRRYRCHDLDPEQPADVEQPAAAFLMFRRDAWEVIQGFDERFYPIWFEDVDFCKRLLDAGFRIRWVPGASASHIGGHSANLLPSESRVRYWYGSLLGYGRMHFSRGAHATLSLAVAFGGLLRLFTGIVRHCSLAPVGIYAKVIRLAGHSLLFGSVGGKRISSGKSKSNRAQIHVL
ncbi:MAG: glycosyltransferase family 2 protein [Acidobacteria bacterium]|nr:glycosyltransferase family 2 protein [Acidobacteriota bacterium]